MKKFNKRIGLILMTCLCFIGFANAEVNKDDKSGATICSIFPALCSVTVSGGNGGGDVPPPPKVGKD